MPERPVLSVTEVFAVADAIAPRYRLLVLLAAFTTLRVGELAALRRRDIDLEGLTVSVLGGEGSGNASLAARAHRSPGDLMAGELPRFKRKSAKSKPEVAPEEILYTDTDRSGDTLDPDLSSLWWYDSDFRPKGRNWPLIWAYIIEGGGSTKTTSATSMAVTAALDGYPGVVFDLDSNMSSTTVLGYDETALKGKKTAIDLLYGRATLDEVALPARYRIGDGDDPEEDFAPIENLRVVPGSPAMADADRAIAEDADRNDWFAEILHSYKGDEAVFYLDFPASYGKMPYSVLRMLDEDDSVIPSIKADPKAVKLVKRLTDELERVRDKNRGCRSVPGRPTLKHLILTGTSPLTWKDQVAARRATADAEAMYSSVLLPYIRYSADAEKIYEDAVPLPILLPDSVASVDYREVTRRMWTVPYLNECGCDYCPDSLE